MCPDDNDLAAFAAQALPPEPQRVVEEHLAGCRECRLALAVMAESAPSAAAPPLHTTVADRPPGQAPPAAANPAGLLSPGTVVGAYRVERLMGQGGMGDIYLAVDAVLGRQVALKVVRADDATSASMTERFLYEARVTARFQHPHIVTVFGAGVVNGRPYLALELLDGENLRARLRRGALSLAEALSTALAITDALVSAHAAGLVHRDLKPENILLPRDGRLRVVDFGLAKPVSQQESLPGAEQEFSRPALTAPGVVTGTPPYMAPELWLASPATSATDIWALGIMLHEMLTGERPHHAASRRELAVLAVRPEPVPLSLPADAPAPLRSLLERMLERSAPRRPTAGEVLATLRQVRDGTARPRARWQGPLLAAAGAVVVGGAVAAGLAVSRAPPVPHPITPPPVPVTDTSARAPAGEEATLASTSAAGPAPRSAAAVASPAPGSPSRRPAVITPPRRATAVQVSIQSHPWGRIFVDGRDTGVFTPAPGLEVSPGRHRFKVVNPELGVSAEWDATVPRTGEYSVSKELR